MGRERGSILPRPLSRLSTLPLFHLLAMVSFERGRFVLRRQPRAGNRSLGDLSISNSQCLLFASFIAYFVFIVRGGGLEHEPSSSTSQYEQNDLWLPLQLSPDVGGKGGGLRVTDLNQHSNPSPLVGGASSAVDLSDETQEQLAPVSYATLGSSDSMQQLVPDEPTEQQNGNGDDLFALNQTYLEHLRLLPPLPKKVHMLFKDKNYFNFHQEVPFVQHSILSLIQLNPDWNVTVYDDHDIDSIIRKAGNSGLISKEEADILLGDKNGEAAHIVERSDIARLILMYTEGGFYLDVDRLISKPMADVLEKNTHLCLPTFNDVNFCQDLMCTSPGNRLFLSMIQEASRYRMTNGPDGKPLERRKGWAKGGDLFELGPPNYNRNILKIVYAGFTEKDYDRQRKGAFMTSARGALANSDGMILTKRETGCDDGLLVDKSIGNCYDREGLYRLYDMKPWAVEVDTLWKD